MKELNEAIINIQTNLNIFAKKTGNNTAGRGYKYFTETDLYNALKPLMLEQGVGYTIETMGEPEFSEKEYHKTDKYGNASTTSMITFWSKGILTLFKGEAEKKINIVLAASNTDPAKAIGSALTYGARYWLCKEFGIPTEELDPDTTENTNKISNNNPKEVEVKVESVVKTAFKEWFKAPKNQSRVKVYFGLEENEDLKRSHIQQLTDAKMADLMKEGN